MATIHVDGKEYEVNGRTTCWKLVCLWALIFLTFAASGAGKCRCLPPVCGEAIPKAEDTRGRLVMSCMTPASDGTLFPLTTKKRNSSVKAWSSGYDQPPARLSGM